METNKKAYLMVTVRVLLCHHQFCNKILFRYPQCRTPKAWCQRFDYDYWCFHRPKTHNQVWSHVGIGNHIDRSNNDLLANYWKQQNKQHTPQQSVVTCTILPSRFSYKICAKYLLLSHYRRYGDSLKIHFH